MRGANSSESEKEQFWCVKEGRERRIRVVLLARGKVRKESGNLNLEREFQVRGVVLMLFDS